MEDSLELKSGVHQFTFQYQLPTNLPSTFAGVYGSVTYVAKVTVSSLTIPSPETERMTSINREGSGGSRGVEMLKKLGG